MDALINLKMPSAINLLAIHQFWTSLPQKWLLVGHSLFCASLAPDMRGNVLLHFITTFVGGFGGGPLTALLIQDPKRAPINILSNDQLGLTWVTCWWLMAYFPFQLVYKLHNLWFIKMITKACVAYMRSNMIAGRVELATQVFPGVTLAPVILGYIAGTGGKHTFDIIRHHYGLLTIPAEGTVPGYSARSALMGTLFYFFTVKFFNILVSQEAAAILTTVFVAHSLLTDLLGLPVDWSYYSMVVMLKISNIPVPTTVPSPLAVATPTKVATDKPKQQQSSPESMARPNGTAANKQADAPAPAAAAAFAPKPQPQPGDDEPHSRDSAAKHPAAAEGELAGAAPAAANGEAKPWYPKPTRQGPGQWQTVEYSKKKKVAVESKKVK